MKGLMTRLTIKEERERERERERGGEFKEIKYDTEERRSTILLHAR